ncbi:MAG: peptide-methionine (S)-S-oxide reductase MsrA [SAR202 cluster bacterium]|nr:peptide-methionine (S)-S-oxide reductase MsrA [SAR202 cluster bacterium]|tara:strand:- start:26286 stop:26825 length:540 start_codon:yes stop_codon:yes gene_type:complete
MDNKSNLATFGGGCFWCLEAIFSKIQGVINVESGYSGGHTQNPNYEEVCSGFTGHAEVIQITYDQNIINFEKLLLIFFSTHDPTTLNRQGHDVGTQYRSAIFFHSIEQKFKTQEYINTLIKEKIYDVIVTEVTEFKHFYKAEEYHQEYYVRNPGNAYCQYNIAPKLAKFKNDFQEILNG